MQLNVARSPIIVLSGQLAAPTFDGLGSRLSEIPCIFSKLLVTIL